MGSDAKGMLKVDRLGCIPDIPYLIFLLKLKSKILFYGSFRSLSQMGFWLTTSNPNRTMQMRPLSTITMPNEVAKHKNNANEAAK